MKTLVRGIHYEITEKTKEQIDKKLKQLSFVESDLMELEIDISHEKFLYILNVKYHLRWGTHEHMKIENKDLYDAIDQFVDKIKTKIKREKEKRIDSTQG